MYEDLCLYIDGQFIKGGGRKEQDVVNPATDEVIGKLPHATKEDLDKALTAAQRAFQTWRKSSPMERSKILRKVADMSRQRAKEIGANITLDMLMRHLNTTYANTLPPGVTLNDKEAKSLLSGSATQGYLTLTAAKDAPPAHRQQAVVVAHVALNFVMKWTYSSRPLTISVDRPAP